MTQNTIKTDWDKTVDFLIKKWDSVCETIAPEIIGKSEDEMRTILKKVTTDVWNTSMDYFIREHSKTLRKLLKI